MSLIAADYVYQLRTPHNGHYLRPEEKLVLLVLADLHVPGGASKLAWPPVRTIAERALMQEWEARDILRSLENKGLIQVTGRGRARAYYFKELDRKL